MEQSQNFMPGAHPNERLEALRTGADSIRTNQHYVRPLSETEEHEAKEELINTGVALREFDREKKEWVDAWKAKVKPVAMEHEIVLERCRTKQMEGKGDLFDFINEESSSMVTYNEHGTLIASRRLNPGEKQQLSLRMEGNSRMFIPNNDFKGKAANDI